MNEIIFENLFEVCGELNGDYVEWERDLDVFIPEPPIDENMVENLINDRNLGEPDGDFDDYDVLIPQTRINRGRYNNFFFC